MEKRRDIRPKYGIIQDFIEIVILVRALQCRGEKLQTQRSYKNKYFQIKYFKNDYINRNRTSILYV